MHAEECFGTVFSLQNWRQRHWLFKEGRFSAQETFDKTRWYLDNDRHKTSLFWLFSLNSAQSWVWLVQKSVSCLTAASDNLWELLYLCLKTPVLKSVGCEGAKFNVFAGMAFNSTDNWKLRHQKCWQRILQNRLRRKELQTSAMPPPAPSHIRQTSVQTTEVIGGCHLPPLGELTTNDWYFEQFQGAGTPWRA